MHPAFGRRQLFSAAGPIPAAALAGVARRLAARAPGWRAQIESHPSTRTGRRVLVTDAYDAWLLRWPPGTRVAPHDHGGSAGAFAVVAGELTELRWHGALRSARTVEPGQVVTIDPDVVHDVVATGPDAAYSLHVYAPPLSSMGFYDSAGVGLVERLVVGGEEDSFVSRDA
jgi:predicted metal-dependent enzyme (double-stranded beta helix superfamily)